MCEFLGAINRTAAFVLAAVLLSVSWSPTAAAVTRKVNCGREDLQKAINLAVNGDTIELTGICQGNFRIDGKDLTLVGASAAGPHGIKGVASDTAGLVISRSNKTVLQNLAFSNGADGGVLIDYSYVTMTDCTASNNAGRGISVHLSSFFSGLRLQINNNLSTGLIALNGSRVDCTECDLNGNSSSQAGARVGAMLTLGDSVVSGKGGLQSLSHSYIDIDCVSLDTTHACSLNATQTAGRAFDDSTVAFYGAGDFWGQVVAEGRSEAQLVGARQLSTGVVRDNSDPSPNLTPRSNIMSDGSMLRVHPLDNTLAGSSRLMGITNVSEFSHALLYADSADGDSALVGVLNCTSGGDAWVDAGVDLTTGSITGCEHAP